VKVLLINPLRENEIIGNNPSIIEEERGCNPFLGLLYIGGYLEKYTDHDIAIIDSQVEKLSYRSLASRICSLKPDVVGLTAMTLTLIDVIKTINIVKELDKNTKIVLGGPHVHLFPNETIKLENVDYLVLGEGEEAFKELLDYIDDISQLRKIRGLVFRDNGNIINTGIRPPIMNLDKLPFPARHLTPYKKYNSLLSKREISTTIFTSRGCPYQCSFCDRPHLGKQFRARSFTSVVDELEECTKMGIYDFLFYDDTFTVNKQRVIDICNEIIKRKLDISWDIRARVDTINEQILNSLKMAGCQGIHYGVEAGTEKILKVLNKGITIKKVREVFELTRKYRIPILAYFMIGNPTETIDDIYTTFKVAKMLNPDYVHLTILTPFPGTKIYFDGLNAGIIKKDYWKAFAANPTSGFIPPHWDDVFTKNELNDLLIKGYRSFYLRPSYIFKRICHLSSFEEFKKKAAAGLKVFAMK
jgi:anaerobic magnesium-protoporphyrin IX monomethyl ester cyclase